MQPENKEAREAVAAAPSLGSRKDRPTPDNASCKTQQGLFASEQEDALERVEDLLACWRWLRSLEHHIRIVKLRFEHCGYPPEEQERLEEEVSDFKNVCSQIAANSKREWRVAA